MVAMPSVGTQMAAKLSADMKRVVAEQRLAFVATVCPDGTPNLSPKGTIAVWDDGHLVFADIRSPGTICNTKKTPSVEINVVDAFSRKGYRFKGIAEVVVAGELFQEIMSFYRGRLVEKHGFIAYQARVHYAMGLVAFWTQPIATAIDFSRVTIRSAIETGDLTFACYGMYQSVAGLLLRNDPLDAVWRESEMALDFAREARYGDAADIIGSDPRFIATSQR